MTAADGLRVGLVLAGGGEVGVAWHAAVLESLRDWSGWDPRGADLVVGTSAGAWVGALLRAGMSPADLATLAADEEVPSPDDVVARFGAGPQLEAPPPPWPPWPPSSPRLMRAVLQRDVRVGSAVAGLLPAGRLATHPVVDGIERLYGDRPSAAPLWLCAVDLEDGRRVVFGREGAPPARVGQAVAASCAVPAYFTPVVVDGRRYIDGGTHSVANLDVCAGAGLDLVLVSAPLAVSGRTPRRLRGLAGRRMMSRRLAREVEAVRDAGTAVVVLAPVAEDLAAMGPLTRAMERARRPRVVAQVRASMRERLETGLAGRELLALRLWRSTVPGQR